MSKPRILVAFVVSTTACGDASAPHDGVLRFAVDTLVVAVGDTVYPTVVLVDPDGRELEHGPVAWWSPDTVLVSVGADGAVSGRVPGYARVFASAAGVVAELPTDVVIRATAIDAAARVPCATAYDGRIYCWVGDRSIMLDDRSCRGCVPGSTPCVVATSGELDRIVGGWNYWCGLASDGAAHCWGENRIGVTLGLGEAGADIWHSPVPLRVAGSARFAILAGSAFHVCGISTAGTVYCWGINGPDDTGIGWPQFDPWNGATKIPAPSTILADRHFTAIASGGNFVCAREEGGPSRCWGRGEFGALGCGNDAINCGMELPEVAGGYDFDALGAGAYHACGITSIGTLYCWGANQRGQLGVATDELCAEYEIGDWPCALVPMAVSTAERFTHVVGSRPYPRPRAGASDFTCGISTDQRAYCWGSNGDGELGMGFVGDDVGEPQQVAGDVRFLSLSLGDDVACGIATDGLVYCWGNGFGPAPTALPHQWRP